MSFKDLDRLEILRKKNAEPGWVNNDLYRLMYRPDFYVVAYERMKSNPGNMTPGADGSTIDGFSMTTIEKIVKEMRDESFQFSRSKRVQIPKAKGGTRPLGIPNPRDKIVQEVIRMILEAIYDSPYGSNFSDNSHGFRPYRSCHSALKSIRNKWNGVTWIVEGDVKAAFDNIHHETLIGVLKKRISDERFLNLIWKALTAGYYEFKKPINSVVGTPQGSIVSPILCNVFLNELDEFCEGLIAKYEAGTAPKRNPVYRKMMAKAANIRKDMGAHALRSIKRQELAVHLKANALAMRNTNPVVGNGQYIRIKYVRYADDWCMGVNGPISIAEKIREEISDYMSKTLKLELNLEKTHIRHAKSEEAFFLGTRIRIGSECPRVSRVHRHGSTFLKRNAGWTPVMMAPVNKLIERLHLKGICDKLGNPQAKYNWAALDDDQIVDMYSSIWRGLANYYSFVDNLVTMSRVQYILKYSAAKTLALKHRSSVPKIFRKHGKMLRVKKVTAKGKPVITRFFHITDWSNKPNDFNVGLMETPDEILKKHQRLRTRSKLGEDCAICGSDENLHMHHVRSIRTIGESVKGFTRLLAKINRKQIPVCFDCHQKIHKGEYDGLALSDLANPETALR